VELWEKVSPEGQVALLALIHQHEICVQTLEKHVAEFEGHGSICMAVTLSYLAGSQHVSQRGMEEVCQPLVGVPVSLGSVIAMQQDLDEALEQFHQRIGEAVQQAVYKNLADYFLIQGHCGRDELEQLVGEEPVGVIGSDRFSASDGLLQKQRHLCWIHLKWDFHAMVDHGGNGKRIGEGPLGQTEQVFDLWSAYREGRLSWPQFRSQMFYRPRLAVEDWVLEGGTCGCEKTERFCFCRFVLICHLGLSTEVESYAYTYDHACLPELH